MLLGAFETQQSWHRHQAKMVNVRDFNLKHRDTVAQREEQNIHPECILRSFMKVIIYLTSIA